MSQFKISMALALVFSVSAVAQATVRDFLPEHSSISPQGSKLRLVFERFSANPLTISVDQEDLGALTFDISYPTYGNALLRQERTIGCGRVVAESDEVDDNGQPLLVTVLVCHLDGDIHDADEVESFIDLLPEGWGHNVGSTEVTGVVDDFTPSNGSGVNYPKPITSWDMVPHQIYDEPFHVDLVIFHRYTYEQSPYGDYDVLVWIDSDPQEEQNPPNADQEPVLAAQARPAFKVPQRGDQPFGTYLVYRATFDPAEYIDPDTQAIVDGAAYIHFKITPARGDVDSVLVSPGYLDTNVWRPDLATLGVQPNIETMKIFMNGGGTLSNTTKKYAVVDPTITNVNESGVWHTDPVQARLDPFATIHKAVQAFQGDSRNLVILVRGGGPVWASRPPGGTGAGDIAGDHWLTIMPDTGDGFDRDDVEITDVAFTITSSAPGNNLFELNNQSGGDISYLWRSGQNEGFEINKEGAEGFPVRIPRANKDVDDLVNAINEDTTLSNAGITATPVNFTHFSVDEGDLYYDDASLAVTIGAGSHPILANSVIRTHWQGSDDVRIFANLDEETFDESDVSDLKAAIELHFTNMTLEVVHDVALSELEDVDYRIPQVFPNTKTWVKADVGAAGPPNDGLQCPFVRYEDCIIRSSTLMSNHVTAAPRHLWLDHSIVRHDSEVSVDSNVIVSRPGEWQGGIWFTGCDWDTVLKSSNGPVMVRDAHFLNVGGDTGKQVSYAMNWFGENVFPVAGEIVHSDYFQWSPDPLVGKNTHGNIIAVNLDFRDEENDGQPFLFNVPGNDNTSHTYTGVALVNHRSNADRTHQFCGHLDHILVWDCDVFQGGGVARRLRFRGVPDSDEHTSIHHNLSVRNSVVERMQVDGRSEGNQFAGDVPSLWALMDSCFFSEQLRDELDIDLTETVIESINDSEAVFTVPRGQLVDFTSDWSPTTSGTHQNYTSLVDRLTAEDIVYRMGASGTERRISPSQMMGAVGAMERPDDTLLQPCEIDLFDIDVGSLTSGTLADLVMSDDERLLVLSAGTPPVVEHVVFAKTHLQAPTSLDLHFEGKITTGTMNGVTLNLWNYSTGDWETTAIDTFTVSSIEAVRVKTGVSLTNHIEDGVIRYRVRFAPTIWLSPSFTTHIDQMKIVVHE